jgi:hypothetical protein
MRLWRGRSTGAETGRNPPRGLGLVRQVGADRRSTSPWDLALFILSSGAFLCASRAGGLLPISFHNASRRTETDASGIIAKVSVI